MRAFIIRPFGKRKGIDFNRVEQELIGPALDSIQAEGRTTGEILEAGNIRIDMFQQLLVADLVIADITTNNPNAFYELGIRHALQEKRTFLIRAREPAPDADASAVPREQWKEQEVPFDLKTDRYLEYDPANPKNSLDSLSAGLRATVASERQDSPVFLSLPNLKPQDREQFLPIPLDFGEEVQRAEKENDARKLTLLGLEASGFTWQSTGMRTVGRALLLIKQYGAARVAWESLRKLDELDLEANISLGNIYERLDNLTKSDQALERALKRATERKHLAEIHGQLGRNRKNRWVREWTGASGEAKARLALQSPLLLEAYEQYLEAYRQDLNSYYPGLNALSLAVIVLELAARFPDDWRSPFPDSGEAKQKLNELERTRDRIVAALQFRFDTALQSRASEEDRKDPWLLSSAGDLSLLTVPNATRAIHFYRKADVANRPFLLDAVRTQLLLFANLGVLEANVQEALSVLTPNSPSPAPARIDRVILFTGHRIDSAKRTSSRFPQAKEELAKNAIRSALQSEKQIATGRTVGVAGGANGGDTLFLELCEELGIRTEMMLALPESQFIRESVEAEDSSWVKRFYHQLSKHPGAPVLAETSELPKWLQLKKGYNIWQRNNLWLLSEALCKAPLNFTLIALWDGETGDGPGGTEHMVDVARECGRVIHLNTKEIFG